MVTLPSQAACLPDLTALCDRRPRRHCKGLDWQTEDGASLVEGNANADVASSEHQSFEWRGGHERMTTGIWMYSEPFFHSAVRARAEQ